MTTTEAIPGYEIEQLLGLVEASTTLGVGTARNRMGRKAERMGANAVVGARYAGGSGGGFTGTICYGTAVACAPGPADARQAGRRRARPNRALLRRREGPRWGATANERCRCHLGGVGNDHRRGR